MLVVSILFQLLADESLYLSIQIFSLLLLLLLPGLLLLLLLPLLSQTLPPAPVTLTLLQHWSHSGHYFTQQIIAGNAYTTKESNLRRSCSDILRKVVIPAWRQLQHNCLCQTEE